MSDDRDRHVEKQQRAALRKLDEERAMVRWARLAVAGGSIFATSVVTGWALVLIWMRGWSLLGAVIGLVVLTIAATFAGGASLAWFFDCRSNLRKAQYAYEDAVLEAAL